MQRARCYLLGETAVVLELEPPVTLATQKRIWRLTQRLAEVSDVVEAIPGMNNITVVLREPQTLALDAIERLQRWSQNHGRSTFRLSTVAMPDLTFLMWRATPGLRKSRSSICMLPLIMWCGF